MNKKEALELETVKTLLSLRLKDYELNEDIKPPKDGTIINGYVFNRYTKTVKKACTDQSYHSIGIWDKTNSRESKPLFSSELKAYKALRMSLQLDFAKELREVDLKIEELEKPIDNSLKEIK